MAISVNPNLRLIGLAKGFLGVREEGGENRGRWVETFQKAVDGKAMGEPWCCAFIQYVVKMVEDEFSITSPLFRSENVWQTWARTPLACRRVHPEPGSLICWNRPKTIMGHIGVVRFPMPGGGCITIEGNTNQQGSRDGDGVYYQEWPRTSTLSLLGYLRVFPEALDGPGGQR